MVTQGRQQQVRKYVVRCLEGIMREWTRCENWMMSVTRMRQHLQAEKGVGTSERARKAGISWSSVQRASEGSHV